MKTKSLLTTQIGVWGICLIVMGWLAATCLFEMHLGWPGSGIQWAKRLVGWAVEIFLVRALIIGVRRFGTAPGK
jgi:hypothetical protein